MAVRALWQCDRDGKMFTSKKDADAHDQMLELAEAIANAVNENVVGLNETQLDDIGRLIARNKDLFSKAFKGKPNELEKLDFAEEVETNELENNTEKKQKDNITQLTKTA
ncbi:YebG family protein [Catenovulum sp. 2E275]|uniref:YebG family protein n=1 Tax=Catenovulum sp. 2E275 TaxID=2980497 RepID=UPI0021D11BED|nr:YebG family protein [Catenovulum sp. 2E275]MCU4675417.1 YebG family protein [Catenovulum sp. 2E275]